MTRSATPVNFTLDLSGRAGPRSGQVARALIEAIASGQVLDGDRLPSTRMVASTFGLARTAVVSAYEELAAAGFLATQPGGSTRVEAGPARRPGPGRSARPRQPRCRGPPRGTRRPPGRTPGLARRSGLTCGPARLTRC